ncbi:MAG: NAD(P) transhydrogenase subunit alpha [Proteobacteria bacterium]|jgi:NAD(P) transhydrogenase subunit alpha|nr:NAD(P) transhydrogenase subunit alpha [Pseudomonadota bacterium]
MDLHSIAQQTARLNSVIQEISGELNNIEGSIRHAIAADGRGSADPFVLGLMVFVLACFVGYYVVWKVTPALHSPLMAVTNAISSVIIVGALVAAGPAVMGISSTFGFIAVVLASVNIFGGFIVTHRMLSMFSKKK